MFLMTIANTETNTDTISTMLTNKLRLIIIMYYKSIHLTQDMDTAEITVLV